MGESLCGATPAIPARDLPARVPGNLPLARGKGSTRGICSKAICCWGCQGLPALGTAGPPLWQKAAAMAATCRRELGTGEATCMAGAGTGEVTAVRSLLSKLTGGSRETSDFRPAAPPQCDLMAELNMHFPRQLTKEQFLEGPAPFSKGRQKEGSWN